mgnify:CR=1 FL=1
MLSEVEVTAIDQLAWECFAWAHPHEAHEQWPERFIAYAHRRTGLTREEIERTLRDTKEELTHDPT